LLPNQYLTVSSFPYASSGANHSLSVSIIVYDESSACLQTPLLIDSGVHLVDNGSICCVDVDQIYVAAGGDFQIYGVAGMLFPSSSLFSKQVIL
jgi:hypothetical protein